MSIVASIPAAAVVASEDPVAARAHRRTMRRLIGALASIAVAGAMAAGIASAPGAAAAAPIVATRMTGQASTALSLIQRFLATLPDELRARLAGPTGSGLRVAELTPAQRQALRAMMRSLVSSEAISVIEEAMRADDALAAAGGGAGSAAWVVGYLEDPRGEGAFLQFAGPEVAVNILLRGAEVSVEPELIFA